MTCTRQSRGSLGSVGLLLCALLPIICANSVVVRMHNPATLNRRTRELQLPILFEVAETVKPGKVIANVIAEYSSGSQGARNFTYALAIR